MKIENRRRERMDVRDDELEKEIKLNLEHLNSEEKKKIIQVIQRDQELRKKHLQTDRIRELRKEISLLEANCPEIPDEHIETANFCIRCKQSFSYGLGYLYYSFLNQAKFCSKCNYKICQQCRIYSANNSSWLCKLCHKYKELKELLLVSGDWIQDQRILKNSNNNRSKFLSHLSGSQIVQINLEPQKKKEIITKESMYHNKSYGSYQELLKTIDNSGPVNNSSKLSIASTTKRFSAININENSIQFRKNLKKHNSSALKLNHDDLINHIENLAENVVEHQKRSSQAELNAKTDTTKRNFGQNLLPNLKQFSDKNQLQVQGDDLGSITSSNMDSSSDIESTNLNRKSNLTNNTNKTENIFKNNTISNINHKQFRTQISFSVDTPSVYLNEPKSFSVSNLLSNKNQSKTSLTSNLDSTIDKEEDIENAFLECKRKNSELKPIENNEKNNEVKDKELLERIESIDTTLNNKTKSHHNAFKSLTRTLSIKNNVFRVKDVTTTKPNPAKIKIKLEYESKSSNLSVCIKQIENLIESYDVYVKMYLVSDQPSKHNKQEDKEKKRKTSVKRNDSSPIFNEVFRYTISYDDLMKHILRVFICHNDKFGRNKILGEFDIPFKNEVLNVKPNSDGDWYEFEKLKTYYGSSFLIRRV